jgi:hypothetical protein
MQGLPVVAGLCLLALLLADGAPRLGEDATLPSEWDDLGQAEPTNAMIGESVKEAELPLTLAKKVCQATWMGTKEACDTLNMQTSKPIDELRTEIKKSGELVMNKALAKLPADTNATMAMESLRVESKIRRTFSRLGESLHTHSMSSPTETKEAEKTLVHTACQILWQSVETMCDNVDSKAEEGKGAVVAVTRTQADMIKTRAADASAIKIALPAPPPAPTSAPAGNATGNATTYVEDVSETQLAEVELGAADDMTQVFALNE